MALLAGRRRAIAHRRRHNPFALGVAEAASAPLQEWPFRSHVGETQIVRLDLDVVGSNSDENLRPLRIPRASHSKRALPMDEANRCRCVGSRGPRDPARRGTAFPAPFTPAAKKPTPKGGPRAPTASCSESYLAPIL